MSAFGTCIADTQLCVSTTVPPTCVPPYLRAVANRFLPGVCSLIEMTRINDYERTNICSGNAHCGAKIFLKSYLKYSFSKKNSRDFLQSFDTLN